MVTLQEKLETISTLLRGSENMDIKESEELKRRQKRELLVMVFKEFANSMKIQQENAYEMLGERPTYYDEKLKEAKDLMRELWEKV